MSRNLLGRKLARKLLVSAGLAVERDEEEDELVIVETTEAGTAELRVELGRGDDLLDAIEDAMLCEEGEDHLEEYGVVLHLAAALAEDGKTVIEAIQALTSPDPDDDGDGDDDGEEDDEEEDDDGEEEEPVVERRSVIDLFPKRQATR